MLTLAAILSQVRTVWPLLKENWKQVSWTLLFLWAVICTLTHCSGTLDPWGRHGTVSDTVITRIDTAWVHPDTNAIFALKWKELRPQYEKHIADSLRTRFRPEAPVIPPAADCSDSLGALIAHSDLLRTLLSECDSMYYDAVAVRGYGDTLKNDSIEINVNFRVEGRLRGVPTVSYRYLAPYPVITVTETVRQTIPQRRMIYAELGAGPDMTMEHTFNSVRVSMGFGYTDRRQWSYGVRGTFSDDRYGVEATVRRSIPIGK